MTRRRRWTRRAGNDPLAAFFAQVEADLDDLDAIADGREFIRPGAIDTTSRPTPPTDTAPLKRSTR